MKIDLTSDMPASAMPEFPPPPEDSEMLDPEVDEDSHIMAELVSEPLENDMVYDVSTWPRMLFEELVRESWSALKQTASKRNDPAWSSLCREVFARLYGIGCDPKEEVQPHHEWAKRVHEMVVELPEWRDTANHSAQNEHMAAETAAAVCAVVHERVPEEELGDPAEEEDYAKALENLRDPEASKAEAEDLEAAIERQWSRVSMLRENADKVDKALAARALDTRSKLRQVLQELIAKKEEQDRCMFALGRGAGLGGLSRKEQSELVKLIVSNDQLRKILELAGRMRIAAIKKQRSKLELGSEEITSVEVGGDLERLLPSELMGFVHPRTRTLAFSRLLERNSLQNEMATRVDKSRGPIFFVKDESGSMSGQPHIYATAAMFGMMQVAMLQRRPFVVVHFGDDAYSHPYKPEAYPSPAKLVEHASSFLAQGTDFANAFRCVSAELDALPEMRKADVVLYTDALAPSELNEAAKECEEILKRYSTELHVVHVTENPNGASDVLRKLATTWVPLKPSENTLQPMDALFGI